MWIGKSLCPQPAVRHNWRGAPRGGHTGWLETADGPSFFFYFFISSPPKVEKKRVREREREADGKLDVELNSQTEERERKKTGGSKRR